MTSVERVDEILRLIDGALEPPPHGQGTTWASAEGLPLGRARFAPHVRTAAELASIAVAG